MIGMITLKNGMTEPKIIAWTIAPGVGFTSASTLREPFSAYWNANNAGAETMNPETSAGTTKRTPYMSTMRIMLLLVNPTIL